jgi:hypothetical protein
VSVADENLRHGAPAGALHHRLALRRVQVDADLFDVRDAALLEQHLRPMAERTDLRGVHLDGLHARSLSKAYA